MRNDINPVRKRLAPRARRRQFGAKSPASSCRFAVHAWPADDCLSEQPKQRMTDSSSPSSVSQRTRILRGTGVRLGKGRRRRCISQERGQRQSCSRGKEVTMAGKKRKRKYSKGSTGEVKREMHRYKRGRAKSGKG